MTTEPLKSIVKISKTNYDTLADTGSVTVNSVTHTYDPDHILYVVDTGMDDSYVQLAGGGGKALSEFALSTALQTEVADRLATDPVFIPMPYTLATSYTFAESVYNQIVSAVNNRQILVGYYDGLSNYVYFPMNAMLDTSVGALKLVYIMPGTVYSTNANYLYNVAVGTSTRAVTSVVRSVVNNPNTLSYNGINLVDSSCLWRAVCAPKQDIYDSSVSSTVTKYLYYYSPHRIIVNPTYSGTSSGYTAVYSGGMVTYYLPSSPYDGETFEFIKVTNTVRLSLRTDSGKYIYTLGKPTNYYSTSYTDYIGYDQGVITVTYSSSMNRWILIYRRIDKLSAWQQLPMVAGRYYYSGSSYSYHNYYTFDNSSIYNKRNSEGNYTLYMPYSWFNYESYIFPVVTGMGGMSGGVMYNKACVESIGSTTYNSSTMWYINITTSDDASPNEGGFFYIIYNTYSAN